ncbi:PAS domain S-box protein [Desulfosarcina sp.]|uniref:PAS domain S-box protein n=1 Tax=Desulfosarcina sp. TaxID=2027861 RepID=UPI0039709C04
MQKSTRPSTSMAREFTKQYLLISLIPVLLFFVFAITGGYFAQRHIFQLLSDSTHELNADAKAELERLGQQIIRDTARNAARQIALFLSFNPAMRMQDLQQSDQFQALALQQVGQTGYVCLYEAETGIMRIHPNPNLVNRKMAFLSDEIPSWWAIFERSLPGDEVSGYYDWIKPDGSLEQKYMTMTPVKGSLHGQPLMVAATTTIDEFTAPVAAMEQKARVINASFHQFLSDQLMVAGIAITVFLSATFFCVYLVGRRSALHYMLPIAMLARTAEHLGGGQWESEVGPALINRQDEIGVLARSFESMRLQLQKLFGDIECRVSELKTAQKSLKESEAHFKGLFDGVPVGLYRTTFDGQAIDANSTLVRMLGYPSKADFLSQNAEKMYAHPVDRSKWQTVIEISGVKNVYEVEMRRYDQSVIWVENHSRTVRGADGSILYVEGSLIDINERKKAESALFKSEKRYRSLYEEAERSKELYRSLLHSSADAIVICDTAQRTTYVSPVFTQLFGWPLDDIKGRQIPFIPASAEEKTTAIVKDVIEKGTTRHGYETQRYTRDGRRIDVSISISRYEDNAGKPAGILQILRDISDRRRMETQLQFAQRMEAIGTLAGGLAHDFNNLMMGILGNISIMMLDTEPTSPHYDKLKKIEKLIQSGSKLTSQLLGYARKGKFELKVVDLNQIVRETAEIFGRTKKAVTVNLDLSATRILVDIDRSQIEQVLFNLLINSADAMPDGGDISLEASIVQYRDKGQKPYKMEPGQYARLQVTDTGHGMNSETQTRIFDPFFTTKEMGRGTGLGLSSAYGIIKAHAGYIEVASETGQGTTFTIYLPLSKREISDADQNDAKIKFGKGTILVVDDEDIVLDIGTEMIGRMGYRVIAARSGDEAIALYRANSGGVDLVILDLIMPGTGGRETFDLLRQINPDVKVLLASGFSIDGQAMELMDRGCNGFIQKPYNLEGLSRKIDEILKNELCL